MQRTRHNPLIDFNFDKTHSNNMLSNLTAPTKHQNNCGSKVAGGVLSYLTETFEIDQFCQLSPSAEISHPK